MRNMHTLFVVLFAAIALTNTIVFCEQQAQDAQLSDQARELLVSKTGKPVKVALLRPAKNNATLNVISAYIESPSTPYEWRLFYNRSDLYAIGGLRADFKYGEPSLPGERAVSSSISGQKQIFTDKCYLKHILAEFDKTSPYKNVKAADVYPEGYCIRKQIGAEDGDFTDEERAFLKAAQAERECAQNGASAAKCPKSKRSLWIQKDRIAYAGGGLRVIADLPEYADKYQASRRVEEPTGAAAANAARSNAPEVLVQRYVSNPLLLTGNKFDIRVYAMLICTGSSHVILYHWGTVQRSPYAFSLEETDLARHVPHAQYFIESWSKTMSDEELQKKYDETQMVFQKFQNIVTKENSMKHAQLERLQFEIKQKIALAMRASVSKLTDNVRGAFHVYACDVVVDDDLRPWLIQMNMFPNLQVDSSAKQHVFPFLARSTTNLIMYLQSDWDAFETRARDLTQQQLESLEILYNGLTGYDIINLKYEIYKGQQREFAKNRASNKTRKNDL